VRPSLIQKETQTGVNISRFIAAELLGTKIDLHLQLLAKE